MARRAFHPDFINHARVYEGWPTEDSIAAWCKARGITFMRNGDYSKVTNGAPGTPKQIARIVAYIRTLGPEYVERRALDSYLATRCLLDPTTLTDADVLDLVSFKVASVLDVLEHPSGDTVLAWTFTKVVDPAKHLALIHSAKDVREAIAWMYVECGRMMVSPRLGAVQAIAAGEDRIGLKLSEYQDRAVAWWEAEPWSVIHAMDGGKVQGMAIALPVRDEIYDEVRSGNRRTYNCKPSEFHWPSRQIIVEGMAMKVIENPANAKPRSNLCLVMAMICQQAYLTMYPGIGKDFPLRFLTFEGTPLARKRAMRMGYKPTGTYQHEMRTQFMERQLFLEGKGLRESWLVGIWTGVQIHLSKLYPRPRPDGRGSDAPGPPPLPASASTDPVPTR